MKKKSLIILLTFAALCTGCGNSNIIEQPENSTTNVETETTENNESDKIQETEVDPFEGVSVLVDGYEPYVKLDFDYDPLDVTYLSSSFELRDPNTIIRNGDSVTVDFIYDEERTKLKKYKYVSTSKEYTIETDGYYIQTPEQLSETMFKEIDERIQAEIENEFLESAVSYRSMQLLARNNDYPLSVDIDYETNTNCLYTYIGAADEEDDSTDIKSKIYLIYEIQCKDSSIGESNVYLTYALDNTTVLYPDQELQIENPEFPQVNDNLDDAKDYVDTEIKSTYHDMEFVEKKLR